MVWDAFRFMIHAHLISLTCAYKKEREWTVSDLIAKIALLETRHMEAIKIFEN